MADIIVNGISRKGNNIHVVGNKVFVDGVDMSPEGKAVTIEIINGNVDNLIVDVCQVINIQGNVGTIESTSGDILVGGDVKESISSISGDVTCSKVFGSVNTVSGTINVVTEPTTLAGVETPKGAQAKADAAESNAKAYTDKEIKKVDEC